jgi:N-acetylmuramoyl-L-alanine amidase
MPVSALLRRFFGGRFARLFMAVSSLAAVGAASAAAVAQYSPQAGVLKVRLGGDQTQTRVVIELDHAASGKLLSQDKPGRQVALALPRVDVAGGEMNGPGAGLVKAWTIDQAAGAARIQLDLGRNARVIRRFLLPPGDGLTVYRYVIDVAPDAASDDGPAGSALAGKAVVKPVSYALTDLPQPDPDAKKVVVIDAGHGGKDPGAEGAERHEKDLTLAAARDLRDRLLRTGRYKVVMTRDTDVFVPLEQRVQIARRANADLFISLHADSGGGDPSIRGATVYTLSEKGTDRVAHGVFDKSDWFMNVALPGQDAATKRILLDLTQRETKNRSSVFAELLLGKIGDKVELLRNSHRDAGFMVLLAPEVPAVLLEMGFISNREDEQLLADPSRRAAFMGEAADAINAYFAQEARYAMR